MKDHCFHVGDRIVTYNPRLSGPGGAIGTVVMVYISAIDCYDVCIDGSPVPLLMFGSDLEPLPPTGTDDATVPRSLEAGADEPRR